MKASKLQNLIFFFYQIIAFKFADFSRFPMTAGMPALWLPFVATTGKKIQQNVGTSTVTWLLLCFAARFESERIDTTLLSHRK